METWIDDNSAATPGYTTQMPIMGWANTIGYTTSLTMIHANSSSPATLFFKVVSKQGQTHQISATAPFPAVANHLVATFDSASGTASLYLSGSLTADSSGDFVMGAAPSGGDSFRGLLENVRLYKRALTATEVLDLQSAGKHGVSPIDGNRAPTVSAGPDQFGRAVNSFSSIPLPLSGTASDDGLTELPLQARWIWNGFVVSTSLTPIPALGFAGP
jgi:hypothetical protein